jgi:hypothetical protein
MTRPSTVCRGGDASSIPKSISSSDGLGATLRAGGAGPARCALWRGRTGVGWAGAVARGAPASSSDGETAALSGGVDGADAVGAVPASRNGGGGGSLGAVGGAVAMGSSGDTSVAGGAVAWRHAPTTTASDKATAPTFSAVASGAFSGFSRTVSPGPRTPPARAATAARHRAHSARCRRTMASSFSVQRPDAMALIWAGGRQLAGTGAVSPTGGEREMRNRRWNAAGPRGQPSPAPRRTVAAVPTRTRGLRDGPRGACSACPGTRAERYS